MAYSIVSFDGVTLNSTSGIRAVFPASTPWERGLTLNESKRRNFQSAVDSLNVEPWQFEVLAHPNGSTRSHAGDCLVIEQTFSPFRKATRQLVATAHDGATLVYLDCYIVGAKKEMETNRGVVYRYTLRSMVPFWQATVQDAVTSSPATNNGNARAYPRLTLAGGGATASYKVYTVTDNTGRGLVSYPVVFAAAITTAARHYCFVNGVSVPTLVATTATAVWARVDVPPSGTTTVVFFYGSSLPVNPLQGTLNLGSLANGSSNTSATNGNSYLHTTFPQAPLTWRPAVATFTTTAPSSYGYDMAETSSSTAFTLSNPGDGSRKDANCLAMTVGAQMGGAGAIGSGLSRVTTNHTTGTRSYLRYRTAGSVNWIDAWTATSNATTTGSISGLDNAVEIIVGIEYTSTTGTNAATLTLSGTYAMTLASTPTVTSAASGTVRIYDGAFSDSTSGTTITFSNYCFADGTLTIDCNPDPNQRSVSNSNADTGATLGSVTFSDPTEWFALDPGPNVIATTISSTPTWTVLKRDSYI